MKTLVPAVKATEKRMRPACVVKREAEEKKIYVKKSNKF